MKIFDETSLIPTCNYRKGRISKIIAIVLHITGDSKQGQAVSWFKDSSARVSSHYVIEKDGSVIVCVNPSYTAYHCGIVNNPTAKIYTDLCGINPNNYTIGIECVSSGEPLTQEQETSLIELINQLCEIFHIPKTRYNIIGHNELDSVDRQFDPIASYSVDDIVKKLGVIKLTTDEAFKILVDNQVINSPDYWKQVVNTVKNFDIFVVNMAQFVLNSKK